MDQKKWIGVDLDGTLAKSNKGTRNNTIGGPIEAMLNRVKKWIEDGEYEVRIFTARASDSKQIFGIQKWLDDNGIGGCKITNQKDGDMLALFDNIAIRVEEDTGKICDECLNYLADSNYKFNSQLNHQPAAINQNNFMRHDFLADC